MSSRSVPSRGGPAETRHSPSHAPKRALIRSWRLPYHSAHHTFPGVPFHRLPELHREIEERLGYRLPSAPYFRLHWGQIQRCARGETELDICAGHDEQLVEEGRLPAPTGG